MTPVIETQQIIKEKGLATDAPRPSVARAEKTQQEIINAAGLLFADKGYKATTIAQICKAANVNQAAVSFHFGGKEQLYIALVRHGYEYALAEIPWPTWDPGTPATVK